MRTTIQLDDHLHELARQYALASGRTFASLVEEALREKLLKRDTKPKKVRVKLRTVGGQGIQPGVDLDNNAALLDVMDTD